MPRISNPYLYRDPNADILAAGSNLAKAFLSGPTQPERDYLQARTDAARAAQAKSNAEVDALAAKQSAVSGIPDLFAPRELPRPDPGFVGPLPQANPTEAFNLQAPEIARTALQIDPKNMGKITEAIAGLMGVNDPRMAQIMMGAGNFNEGVAKGFTQRSLSPDDQRTSVLGQAAFGPTLPQVEADAFVNLDPRTQALAVGPTETQTRGTLGAENFNKLSGLSPEQQQYLGADPAQQTPRNVTVDGQHVGYTTNNKTLMDGTPIPPRAAISTTQTNAVPTSVRAAAMKRDVSVRRFGGLLNYTRQLAQQDPLNFGFPGWVKGTLQDAQAFATGVSQALGYEAPDQALASIRGEAARISVAPGSGLSFGVIKGMFDSRLPKLQSAANLLLYSAASALAGQEGRDISDKDIAVMRSVAGNPENWLTSQEKFLSKLDAMEEIIAAFGGNAPAAPQPAPQQGAAQAPSNDPLGIR